MGLIIQAKEHKLRAWKSICTSLSFATLGFCSGLIGPTMLDLQLLVNTTVDQITHILPMRAFGNIVGSTASGFTMHYIDHQVGLIGTLFFSSLALFLIPFCKTLYLLFLVLFFNGFTGGYLANCGNTYILHQWGKESAPFIQLVHFSFGLGAFIGPFIAGPFLKPIEELETINNNFTSTSNSTYLIDQSILKKKIYVDPDTLNVKYAYFITGFLNFVIFIIFLITYLKNKSNKPHPTREVKKKKVEEKFNQEVNVPHISSLKSEEFSNEIKEKQVKSFKKHHKYVLVALSSIFTHLTYGLELSFGLLLPTFAVKSDLHLSKAAASYASSFYWGCFTFSRLFTIVMVSSLSSRTMLIVDLVLIMAGNFILLPFGSVHQWALIVGSAFLGVGVSTAFPTVLSYLENIMPLTSKFTAIISVSSSIGEFIIPVLIGNYIETWPMIFIYIIFGYSCLASISFSICCLWEYIMIKYKNST